MAAARHGTSAASTVVAPYTAPMDLLFVADPLERFKAYKDTTYAMMREAAARGHGVLACEPRDLAWTRGSRVTALRARRIAITGDLKAWF